MTDFSTQSSGAAVPMAAITEHHTTADAKKVVALFNNGSSYVEASSTFPFPVATAKNEALTVTHGSINIGAGTQSTVLAGNANRVWAVISQASAGLATMRFGGSATSSDIPINGRGASYEIGPDNFWDGSVSVFNTTANSITISVAEGTNP